MEFAEDDTGSNSVSSPAKLGKWQPVGQAAVLGEIFVTRHPMTVLSFRELGGSELRAESPGSPGASQPHPPILKRCAAPRFGWDLPKISARP
jgi:hypothetical protein